MTGSKAVAPGPDYSLSNIHYSFLRSAVGTHELETEDGFSITFSPYFFGSDPSKILVTPQSGFTHVRKARKSVFSLLTRQQR
jgi:hypothetical protein